MLPSANPFDLLRNWSLIKLLHHFHFIAVNFKIIEDKCYKRGLRKYCCKQNYISKLKNDLYIIVEIVVNWKIKLPNLI